MYTRGVIVLFYDWCIESKNEYLLQEWNCEKNQSVSSHTEHTTSKTKVWWKCLLCGHEWETAICYRYKGSGCSECAKEWKISFPEKAIVYYLLQTGLEFYENYHADWLNELDLDIYVPSLNLGISYDGPLHQNLEKELRKNSFCERNGTYLFRICDLKCVEIPPFTGMCIRRSDNTDSTL